MLKWICERIEGTGKAVQTPIGLLPTPDAIDTSGLKISQADLDELLKVDIEGWTQEALDVSENYKKFGDRLPAALENELRDLKDRLVAAATPK